MARKKEYKSSAMLPGLRRGLTGYSCARAFLAWNVGVFALFFTLKHYRLIPDLEARADQSAGYVAQYLYEVSVRILKVVCLPMALVLIASVGYALCLAAASRAQLRALSERAKPTTELRTSLVGRVIGWLVGLPNLARDEALERFVDRGGAYATAPLRDAVTLFPAVGFLGTVVGVTIALGGLQQVMASAKGGAGRLLDGLMTAFDTTFLGLLAALVLTVVLFVIDAAIAQIAALLDDPLQRGHYASARDTASEEELP